MVRAHAQVERIDYVMLGDGPHPKILVLFTSSFATVIHLSVQSSLVEELAAGYSQIWLLEAGTRSGRGRNVRQSPRAVRRGEEMRLRLCL